MISVRNHLKIKIKNKNECPAPLLSFNDLSLKDSMPRKTLKSFRNNGWIEPTPIQSQVIPAILSDKEILAISPTGSGKTLSFLIPIMIGLRRETINKPKLKKIKGVRAIVIEPTRELAGQIIRVALSFIKSFELSIKLGSKAYVFSGGNSNDCDIMVGTPSRIVSFLFNGKIIIGLASYLVLDEADSLIAESYATEIDCVIKIIEKEKDIVKNSKEKTYNKTIRCLFSSTLSEEIEEILTNVLRNPVIITMDCRNKVAKSVEQHLLFVGNETGKIYTMRQLLIDGYLTMPILIFVKSKKRAMTLHRKFLFDNLPVDSIHASQPQCTRNLAVENFRSGKTHILIATDLICRGMDFPFIKCVINFDFPKSKINYIHHVGRTGRFERYGLAITFFTNKDCPFLKPVVNIVKQSGGVMPDWSFDISLNKFMFIKTRTDSSKTVIRKRVG